MSKPAAIFLTAAALLTLAGCHVDTHKGANGDDNVKIATPFGGMSVKTDDAIQGGVGLTPYPGASIVHEDSGNHNGSADVNFDFGGMHLGVKAISYQTPDAPAKVLAFYEKDMAHFGAIIHCQGTKTVGQPTRTAEGLTCQETDSKHHVNISDDGQEELKAGSRLHQHIASFEAKNGGTRIGLVALDLPGALAGSDDDSRQ